MGKRVIDKGTAFWLMASAGLIGVITLQMKDQPWLAPPVTAATVAPAPQQDRPEDGYLASPLDADWLDEIVERPLFSASRRPFSPPEEKPAAKAEPKAEPLAFTLAGTLLSGESRVALLAHPTDGLLRLRQGQEVDGWRVDEIREDEVRLRRGPEVTLLSLRKGAFRVIRLPAARDGQPRPALV